MYFCEMRFWLIISFLVLSIAQVFGQAPYIRVSETNISQSTLFSISVVSENTPIREHSSFPDLEHFIKKNIKGSTASNLVNGQIVTEYILTQYYEAEKAGSFKISRYKIKVNDETLHGSGLKINVTESEKKESSEKLIASSKKEEQEVREHVKLVLDISVDKPFVGQSFLVNLVLLTDKENKSDLEFVEIQSQIDEFRERLKPASCLENVFQQDELLTEKVTISGKEYIRMVLYKALYTPISAGDIRFPAVGFKMLRGKLIKGRGFNYEKSQELIVFGSEPVTIQVKELPAHALKDKVAGGRFALAASVSKNPVKVGESVLLTLRVKGNSLSPAEFRIFKQKGIEFFEPEVRENVDWKNGEPEVEYVYKYYLVPKLHGVFKLKEMLGWIYFNTTENRYDTLKPQIELKILGKNVAIAENDGDYYGFYSLIGKEKNKFVDKKREELFKVIANNILLLMFLTTIYFLLKRQRRFRAVIRQKIRRVNMKE